MKEGGSGTERGKSQVRWCMLGISEAERARLQDPRPAWATQQDLVSKHDPEKYWQ